MRSEQPQHEIGIHRGAGAVRPVNLLGAVGQLTGANQGGILRLGYAEHYRVPVALVHAIIQRESNWQPCTVAGKGAVGLMKLMPMTAERLGVRDRCNLDQNVSGGVAYLAWLMQQFHNDLRLVAAAYYAGEDAIGRRDLEYQNRDVVAYVAAIRIAYLREAGIQSGNKRIIEKRDVR